MPQDFPHLNSFIKQLDLSPKVVTIINQTFTTNNHHQLNFDKKLFTKKINWLIKRNFHTKQSSPILDGDGKNVKSKLADHKKSEQIKDLLSKFSLKPHIQLKLIEAYQLGYDRSISSMGNAKKKTGTSFTTLGSILLILYFIYTFLPDVGKNVSNSGSISKYFSRSWGESGATLVNKVDVKFDDVQGCDEVKKELQDIVSFLKNPSIFTQIGARLPKGVLLYGAPGVGKTLLARAVAGEAGVPFIYISGSQFDEMFVGVGASRIRSLFAEAKENSPCVVFIDELDAVCGERTSSLGHPYANQSINQLLAEMDGFIENEGIIVIGATNRVKSLDKAILRPGRFDLKVEVQLPDYRGRLALFRLYLSRVTTVALAPMTTTANGVDSDNGSGTLDHNCGGTGYDNQRQIDITKLARSTIGYSGADIRNMVNQAAIICALNDDRAVTMSHLWEAQTKITLGSARDRPMLEKDNRITAYHEAGHSIVMYFSPNSPNKVKLVSIIPRGQTGGHNSFVPKEESQYQTKSELMAVLDGLMGGRAAEELLNGNDNISTGVSSDMKHATDIARKMVRLFSMSDEVGLQVFENRNCDCGSLSTSPRVAEQIDSEVNKILKDSYERAKSILSEHQKEWNSLAQNLLKYETLEGDDVELVINGKKPKVALRISEEQMSQDKKSISPLANHANRLFGLFSAKDIKK